jgi:hypothetical protein
VFRASGQPQWQLVARESNSEVEADQLPEILWRAGSDIVEGSLGWDIEVFFLDVE